LFRPSLTTLFHDNIKHFIKYQNYIRAVIAFSTCCIIFELLFFQIPGFFLSSLLSGIVSAFFLDSVFKTKFTLMAAVACINIAVCFLELVLSFRYFTPYDIEIETGGFGTLLASHVISSLKMMYYGGVPWVILILIISAILGSIGGLLEQKIHAWVRSKKIVS